jgi:5-methylcytosine-specific restriction endonuclease McrA
MGIPEASEQLHFLTNIQRVLEEGNFVTTYKFALLMSLADYAVIKGNDSGDACTIMVSELSEGVVSYYWKQVAPYYADGKDGMPCFLKYGTGKGAPTVVQKIMALNQDPRVRGSLFAAKRVGADWQKLINSTTLTIQRMPLWKLQVVSNEVVPFLYRQDMQGMTITLLPGVLYCLRTHYPLLRSLIQAAWVRTVHKWNKAILGHHELNDFLFGIQRQATQQAYSVLREFQEGRCFYCNARIKSRGDIDHFIPWVRYPLHLGHNFVLSHETCNRRKSDSLASLQDFDRWWQRNNENPSLITLFDQAGVLHDLPLTNTVGMWAYR